MGVYLPKMLDTPSTEMSRLPVLASRLRTNSANFGMKKQYPTWAPPDPKIASPSSQKCGSANIRIWSLKLTWGDLLMMISVLTWEDLFLLGAGTPSVGVNSLRNLDFVHRK